MLSTGPRITWLIRDMVLGISLGSLLCYFSYSMFTSPTSVLSGYFIGLAGLGYLSLGLLSAGWLMTRSPSLVVNEQGVQIRTILGNVHKASWEDISHISVRTGGIFDRHYFPFYPKYLTFIRKGEKANHLRRPPLSINNHRIDIPLESAIEKMLKIKDAMNRADKSVIEFKSASEAFSYAILIVLGLTFIVAAIAVLTAEAPIRHKKSPQVTNVQAGDMTPTTVKVECQRLANESEASCELWEHYLAKGHLKRHERINKVTGVIVKGKALPVIYLNFTGGRTQLAIIRPKKTKNVQDLPTNGPMRQIEKLGKFLKDPKELGSITVTFRQPLILR